MEDPASFRIGMQTTHNMPLLACAGSTGYPQPTQNGCPKTMLKLIVTSHFRCVVCSFAARKYIAKLARQPITKCNAKGADMF